MMSLYVGNTNNNAECTSNLTFNKIGTDFLHLTMSKSTEGTLALQLSKLSKYSTMHIKMFSILFK